MNKSNSMRRGLDPLTLLATIVFGISFGLSPFIIYWYKPNLPVHVLVAFIPFISFIFFLLRFNYSVNILDELGKRIHQESIIYALTLVVVFGMVEYTLKLTFPHLDAVNYIPTGFGWLPIWYILGGAVVNKRYQ